MELLEFHTVSISCKSFDKLRKRTEEMECKCLERSVPETNVTGEVSKARYTVLSAYLAVKGFTVSLITNFHSTYTCESRLSIDLEDVE